MPVADRVERHARVSPGATGDDYHGVGVGVGVGVWHADPGDRGDRAALEPAQAGWLFSGPGLAGADRPGAGR